MILAIRTANKLAETVADVRAIVGGKNVLGLPISATTPCALKLPEGLGGIVLTSAAALPALPPEARRLPVFCVGGATAKAAINAGFNVPLVGEEDAQALAEEIVRTILPCRLFHPTADTASTHFYTHLKTFRFQVLSATAYTTEFTTALPAEVVENWQKITQCLFFSTKSAAHFCTLASQNGLNCDRKQAVVLSKNIAAALQGFNTITIAQQPTKEFIYRELRQQN